MYVCSDGDLFSGSPLSVGGVERVAGGCPGCLIVGEVSQSISFISISFTFEN